MRLWFLPIILMLGFAYPASGQDFNPRKIYQKASNAVVLIAAFDRNNKSASTGTGSIISEGGLILTNAHVIFNEERDKPFDSIRIFLKPDRVTGNLKKDASRKFRATLVHYSNPMDLAVLKIQNPQFSNPIPLLKLSNLQDTSIGDPVLAIGHPEQGGLWTLTTGTISSMIESFENIRGKDVFQTETSINRGNSGGPLIDRHGHMVGINSMIARQGKGGITITDINFSIKSTVAMKWMRSVGYSHSYAMPKQQTATPPPEKQAPTEKAGIVPVPTQKPESTEIKPEPKQNFPRKPEILTEVRPYKEQDLFEQVEDELEDMMDEMKGRIRSR
ncbi:MAG: trypsin-like peptidase domain-containing protein [Nitrospina sp.]|jgi:serine protease Do|nr:trypsin-like peptidase domain-containing protein [Nitrospina sp.]